MPLHSLDRGHHRPAIQPHRLAEYAALGGGAGAATHALGSAILRQVDPDHFQVGQAALVGLAGGAALNGAYGLLAALAPGRHTSRELHRMAGITLLSASLGAFAGTAIVQAGGGEGIGVGHAVAAGLVGGAVLGTAGGTLRMAHYVCCCCWPSWLSADEPSEHGSIFGDEEEHHRGLIERMTHHRSDGSFSSAHGEP